MATLIIRDRLAALSSLSCHHPSEAKRCWSLVAHEDFWRSHYTWHPKKKRVKTWMFVHGRFRETAVSLVQATLSIKDSVVAPGFSGQAGRAAADATEASFKTLVKKIYQHSEFEDTQLFRFFREHLPDIRDDIRDLEADHSEKKLEENVLSSLHAFKEEAVKCKPDEASSSSSSVARAEQLAEEVVESVRAYATGLDTHLQKEERMLVGRWLNLTPQLYSTYRGYLVGKYRIAY